MFVGAQQALQRVGGRQARNWPRLEFLDQANRSLSRDSYYCIGGTTGSADFVYSLIPGLRLLSVNFMTPLRGGEEEEACVAPVA